MHSRLKEAGWLTTTPADGGPVETVGTAQCCHCGCHWVWQKGSGRVRGWCMSCGGLTCGNEACDVCVPTEQMLENIEAGRPLDFRPIIAPGGWEG